MTLEPAEHELARSRLLPAFPGLLLLGAAWAFATQCRGTADELDHVMHTADVAGGEFVAAPRSAHRGTGAYHQVPEALNRPRPIAYRKPPSS